MAPNSRGATRRVCRPVAVLCALAATTHVLVGDAEAQDAPRTLTLKQAVELATRESPSLRVAALQSAEAQTRVAVARSATLPHVGMRASNGYQTSNLEGLGLRIPGLTDRLGPFQQFDARPTVTHNLLALDLSRQVRVATETAAEQHWREQASREAVALAVIEGYLEALKADARLESAKARLETAEALRDEARRFVEVGTASRLDEARATLRCEIERAAVMDLTAERDVRTVLLLKLLGLPPDRPVQLTDQLAPPSAARLDENHLRTAVPDARPELKAAQAQLRAATAERRRAEAERFPTIALAADFGLFGRSVGSNLRTYGIRAAVSVPIYEGGRIDAGIRSATLKTLEAEEALRDARLQVTADIQVARVQLAAALQAHAAAIAAVAAARTALELAQARFVEGLSTNIDVVTAQEALAAAEAFEIERRYGFYAARAKQARAHGDIMTLFDE
jgi:outer membrane protein TolC